MTVTLGWDDVTGGVGVWNSPDTKWTAALYRSVVELLLRTREQNRNKDWKPFRMFVFGMEVKSVVHEEGQSPNNSFEWGGATSYVQTSWKNMYLKAAWKVHLWWKFAF